MSRCVVLMCIGKNAQHGYTKVSICDYLTLRTLGKTLSLAKMGYPRYQNFYGGNQPEYLHRIIFYLANGRHPSNGEVVDHIDGDKFNNTRDNIRSASYRENAINRKLGRTNTSGFMGVSWRKDKRKWAVRIHTGTKYAHLGYFASAEEGYEVYKAAVVKYHGEFGISSLSRQDIKNAQKERSNDRRP